MNYLTAILCALCVLCGSTGAAEASQKPNIIVILADDLGYGDLACYGSSKVATPNLNHMAKEAFAGKGKLGIYGDAIQELDWSTGEILKTLKDLGQDANTLVIFTSDNGPHPGQGTSAGPLRGEKGSTFEGGVRVPCLMRWAGKIPADRVTDEPTAMMDLLPTLVPLAGGTVPSDRVIDGKDVWPVISGADGATSPHKAIDYLRGRSVVGVRMGDWKYLVTSDNENSPEFEIELSEEEKKLPRKQRNAILKERKKAAQGKQGDIEMLFNLRDDIGEQSNLSAKHPYIVVRLKKQVEDFSGEFAKPLVLLALPDQRNR